jgi:hypothetical protein
MYIRNILSERYAEDLTFLSGKQYDVAILGVCESFGCTYQVCYDIEMLSVLNGNLNISGLDDICLVERFYDDETSDTRDSLTETHGELLFLTEGYYDKCIIGVSIGINGEPCVCYDKDKLIETFMMLNETSWEDASENYYFNIIGSYLGEQTPIYLDTAIEDLDI